MPKHFVTIRLIKRLFSAWYWSVRDGEEDGGEDGSSDLESTSSRGRGRPLSSIGSSGRLVCREVGEGQWEDDILTSEQYISSPALYRTLLQFHNFIMSLKIYIILCTETEVKCTRTKVIFIPNIIRLRFRKMVWTSSIYSSPHGLQKVLRRSGPCSFCRETGGSSCDLKC